uniref:Uncharacterized protein n=1 Tax=Euplotes harpa TaxID=151035 RepID=A0A7S3JF28_9SPIT|mmetsp:Transcript_33297/g.38225  ORF Transcript_33297/g.38225 Transcript_33297/m.38225 type:complete len:165 (+) Transcript_33297:1160-1654(+)
MQELSDYFNDMGDLYENNDDNMKEINKLISTLISSWGDAFQGQSDLVKNAFPRYFKYNMEENKSMLEILEHRNTTKDKFAKMQTELETLKSKLYTERDFSKWKMSEEDMKMIDEIDQDEYLTKSKMLPEETQNLKEQRLLLNYLNNTLDSEIKRVFRYSFKDLK